MYLFFSIDRYLVIGSPQSSGNNHTKGSVVFCNPYNSDACTTYNDSVSDSFIGIYHSLNYVNYFNLFDYPITSECIYIYW